jgi:hypothetical protein
MSDAPWIQERKEQIDYVKHLQELLYQCVRELDYVQSVENCHSGLCATSLGKHLVEEGMRTLFVTDLSKESLFE